MTRGNGTDAPPKTLKQVLTISLIATYKEGTPAVAALPMGHPKPDMDP